jgi:hypothetical protein
MSKFLYHSGTRVRAGPESRDERGRIWIPDSLALPALRNDDRL